MDKPRREYRETHSEITGLFGINPFGILEPVKVIEIECRSSVLFRRGAKSYDEAYFESLSKSAEEPENTGGLDMIICHCGIGAGPSGVDEMIHMRRRRRTAMKHYKDCQMDDDQSGKNESIDRGKGIGQS